MSWGTVPVALGQTACHLVREAARALLAALREDATSMIVRRATTPDGPSRCGAGFAVAQVRRASAAIPCSTHVCKKDGSKDAALPPRCGTSCKHAALPGAA